MTRMASALLALALFAPGCGSRSTPSDDGAAPVEPVDGVTPAAPQPDDGESLPGTEGNGDADVNAVPPMPVEDCEKVGTVVGDPGDGRTRRPDFMCPNGKKPIGTVSLGIEGSVCCPH